MKNLLNYIYYYWIEYIFPAVDEALDFNVSPLGCFIWVGLFLGLVIGYFFN